MNAWIVDHPSSIDKGPLRFTERPDPIPNGNEIRVKASACGVCRTDLHLAEGDLPPKRHGVIPGHEIVGTVDIAGTDVKRFKLGDRVGIAWLRGTCGVCRFCRQGHENLCLSPTFTGWDEDGGFAEYAVANANYVYALPTEYTDVEAAPLLCAGIIGYRALQRADLPAGGRLGIYGFGASAHLAAQVALSEGAEVYVMTRSGAARELALELGAASAVGAYDKPPVPLDSAILFAPVGDLVPVAMEALNRGGTLSIAGIHLTAIPSLDYDDHLFQEKSLRSVTANTRSDGEEFIAWASLHRPRVVTTTYKFSQAQEALSDLANDRVNGVAVLQLQ
jgi:propanol-preferring alcohol dehydrogenase